MTKTTGAASSETVAGESDLVLASQEGNSDAFARLYDGYVQRIYRYVYFRVSDDQLAEDITSNVFLKAWENLHRYRISGSPFIVWLYRIAHNAVIDHYRTAKPTVELQETIMATNPLEDDLEDGLDRQIESEKLRQSLQRLTEEQQQVLTLKFIAGMSTSEVAKQIGKREGAVRALQMRALQALAKDLGLMELEV